MGELLHLFFLIAAFFWFIQLLNVLGTDMGCFESHAHKLLWFLVVLSSFLIGAVWFVMWKKQATAGMIRRYDAEIGKNRTDKEGGDYGSA